MYFFQGLVYLALSCFHGHYHKLERTENIVIIGGGPAAHTAAIYAARAELNPVLYEGVAAGGQLITTTHIENFPGFPEEISGPALMEKMKKQSEKFGTRIVSENVIGIETHRGNNGLTLYTVHTATQSVKTRTVVVATGASAKRTDIPGTGDNELWNRGVSACTICDGSLPMFRNKIVFVIGGGDSAMEEALFLTKFASAVYIVHRRDTLRASKIMQSRAKNNRKIKILFSSVVTEAHGKDHLDAVTVRNLKNNTTEKHGASGLFFAIGHTPNTAFLPEEIQRDDTGYVLVEKGSTKTTMDGIFCAGDAHDKKWRQAITAAGTGCMAALEAERYLEETK
ncbi:MAG: thioredoxin reductase [Amphiamblys sp. WSBS2006]|nr:MAG: thioredoxin reductase [Amphiamblys sp. WSBS2006]